MRRAVAALLSGLAALPALGQNAPAPTPHPSGAQPCHDSPTSCDPRLPAPPPSAPASNTQPAQPEPATAPRPAALERYENRPIREVKLVGLKTVEPQLVDNQIRSKPGQPLSIEAVQQDIQRLNRLGRFSKIDVKAQSFDDGSISLIYEFAEVPIIKGVEAVGNRQLTTNEIGSVVGLLEGTPVDRYQLDRARRQIQELYRKKGYYLSEVTVDEQELDKTGIVPLPHPRRRAGQDRRDPLRGVRQQGALVHRGAAVPAHQVAGVQLVRDRAAGRPDAGPGRRVADLLLPGPRVPRRAGRPSRADRPQRA